MGGASRGRKLTSPVGPNVRPTTDRVREAIFDILGSILAFEGLDVLDLFAGTGAMGIEALSRGAGTATFVDRDDHAVSAVRANLVSTGLAGPSARVLRRDAFEFLSEVPDQFDLAFCDPPYDFDSWPGLLGHLRAAVAVLESGAELSVPEGWMVIRHRRYGSTLVTVVRGAQDRRGGPV